MPERPLVFLDIESAVPAGKRPDPAQDRVVHLALKIIPPRVTRAADSDLSPDLLFTADDSIAINCDELIDSPSPRNYLFECNPGFLMSAENIAIHGITNEQAATYSTFKSQAAAIHAAVAGCDLAGYNSNNYDIPLLWEEFARAGIIWNLDDVYKIDVGNIFKKKEERTLTAAVKFYCQRDHTGAHGAMADATATADVFDAQIARYDIGAKTRAELAELSAYDSRVDLAGKLVRRADGLSDVVAHHAIGTPVHEDRGFGGWMMRQDFSMNTKMVLQKFLHGQPPGIPRTGTTPPSN
jgi:DNA polymerase-3 subunit epsilon